MKEVEIVILVLVSLSFLVLVGILLLLLFKRSEKDMEGKLDANRGRLSVRFIRRLIVLEVY